MKVPQLMRVGPQNIQTFNQAKVAEVNKHLEETLNLKVLLMTNYDFGFPNT